MFEQLTWRSDRALLGDLVFRIEQAKDDRWELGDDCFRFYKNRQLVEQFDRFWSTTAFRPRRMLEIGIWDGGSTALWYETLGTERLVAIDLMEREDSAYFRRYVAANELDARVMTRWGTNQADRATLHEIVERDLGGELDFVIDDGSHLRADAGEFRDLLSAAAARRRVHHRGLGVGALAGVSGRGQFLGRRRGAHEARLRARGGDRHLADAHPRVVGVCKGFVAIEHAATA